MTPDALKAQLASWRNRFISTDEFEECVISCADAWAGDVGMWKDAERQVDRLQAVDGLSGTVHVYRATVLELTKRLEADKQEWAEDREQLDVAGKTIAAFAERERTLRQRLEAALNDAEMLGPAQDEIADLRKRLEATRNLLLAANRDISGNACIRCGGTDWVCETDVDAALAAGEWVPHVNKEGSREHVVHWDSMGSHCSEPRCEVNRPSEEKK